MPRIALQFFKEFICLQYKKKKNFKEFFCNLIIFCNSRVLIRGMKHISDVAVNRTMKKKLYFSWLQDKYVTRQFHEVSSSGNGLKLILIISWSEKLLLSVPDYSIHVLFDNRHSSKDSDHYVIAAKVRTHWKAEIKLSAKEEAWRLRQLLAKMEMNILTILRDCISSLLNWNWARNAAYEVSLAFKQLKNSKTTNSDDS